MTVTANLRRDARIDVRVPVTVIRGKTTLALETLDVSFRGLCLGCKEPPALRSLVRLKVTVPGSNRTIEVHAMAVHVIAAGDDREGGVGLQFWGLSGADRQAWEDFIRALIVKRRETAKNAAREALSAAHPANSEMNTPSGIRTVAGALSHAPPSPPRARTK
jgi:hypothetical protein